MKLLPKKKYNELLDTISHYENKIHYFESALDSLDNYSCNLRRNAFDLQLDLKYANESYQLLKNDYDKLKEELKKQKQTNRRLINIMFNPKIK